MTGAAAPDRRCRMLSASRITMSTPRVQVMGLVSERRFVPVSGSRIIVSNSAPSIRTVTAVRAREKVCAINSLYPADLGSEPCPPELLQERRPGVIEAVNAPISRWAYVSCSVEPRLHERVLGSVSARDRCFGHDAPIRQGQVLDDCAISQAHTSNP
jgi:hypothetical protein